MFLGRSQFHQEQSVGLFLENDVYFGYPSNLIDKTNWDGYVDQNGIIKNKLTSGDLIYFPIAIAQKALGHYDKFIRDGLEDDKCHVINYADFLIKLMTDKGLVSNWHLQNRAVLNNYSAMAQGEVISVLCRAFILTSNEKYLSSATLASQCLLSESDLKLLVTIDSFSLLSEMPNDEGNVILNGCFFSLWGLIDLNRVNPSKVLTDKVDYYIFSLKKSIEKFDIGYWSLYDLNGALASPFYHRLHINQLKAMSLITGDSYFLNVANKWSKYEKNKFYYFKALSIKSIQKLKSKRYNEFI
ncbi:D-glucuronyl C5-epimerase family protein [Shewanella inventionis]|uniref:D-glucuronyl C5-epimerase C-terminal domain-containing protein n=1 Tax=Shewanella inventionis TaxID=1738770 RepID=A0ABQ1J5H8_9GAMM|nr:D-glucuronyl C5-epimerase family protein [Shewanella inventionis]MCL1159249.1 D-glucuronyl C5-epimerase family protein [Shewanella inventionis]GGB60542.1 hypothetical protein GCM10011607_21530 [Shewanella inventionis]